MTVQSITIQLPDLVYRQVAQRARRKRRTLEDEVVAAVTNTVPTLEDLPADLVDSLEQLTFLTDIELWQAAQSMLPTDESEQMQRLITKQQREGLTSREQHKAESLVDRYQRNLLIRAQAALLLKERGYNIAVLRSLPAQQAPQPTRPTV